MKKNLFVQISLVLALASVAVACGQQTSTKRKIRGGSGVEDSSALIKSVNGQGDAIERAKLNGEWQTDCLDIGGKYFKRRLTFVEPAEAIFEEFQYDQFECDSDSIGYKSSQMIGTDVKLVSIMVPSDVEGEFNTVNSLSFTYTDESNQGHTILFSELENGVGKVNFQSLNYKKNW